MADRTGKHPLENIVRSIEIALNSADQGIYMTADNKIFLDKDKKGRTWLVRETEWCREGFFDAVNNGGVELTPELEEKIAQKLADKWIETDFQMSARQEVEFIFEELKNLHEVEAKHGVKIVKMKFEVLK